MIAQETLIERLFERLVSGDQLGARTLVDDILAQGVSIDALIELIYEPVQRMINALHQAGQLTDLAHFSSTHLLQTLLDDARVRARSADDARSKFTPSAARTITALDPRDQFIRALRNEAAATDDDESVHGLTRQAQFVSLSFHRGTLTAHIIGPAFGERQAPIIRQELTDAIDSLDRGLRTLVLDLSDVRIMSSLGLSLCMELRRQTHARGGRTVLFGLNDQLRELLRMMKVDRLYTTVNTAAELRQAIAA